MNNTIGKPRDRRKFLKSASVAAGALALGTHSLPAQSAPQRYQWRMATSWPGGFPIFEHGALRFAENVNTMSGGRMRIEVDSANKHKAPFGVFDMVHGGQYEMGHSCSYYWKGRDPALTTLATIPFGMTAQEQNAWFWYQDGVELMNKAYGRHGMYSFNAGNTGVQMGGWFRKEINSLEDLKGLKIRIPGLAGEVLARVGAQPVVIPVGELYTSLEKNVIDALEWVGPYQDLKMGFQQIAEYYYTGWHEPGTELQYLVNRQAFDALPADLQAIMKVAMKESSFDMLCESVYRNTMTWKELAAEYPNVKVRRFPPDVIAELQKQTRLILDEMLGESPLMKEILESQRSFLAKSRKWSAASELQYLKIRG